MITYYFRELQETTLYYIVWSNIFNSFLVIKNLIGNVVGRLVGWLVGCFYGVSTFEGYLKINPFLYI